MARIRSDVKQLGELLSDCSSPVYLLDDRRRVIYCNEACLDWLEVRRDQLSGRRCDYHSESDPSDRVAAICPPPEAFVGGYSEQAIVFRNSNGQVVRRRIRFVSLGDEAHCVGVIAVAASSDEEFPGTTAAGDATATSLHEQLQQLLQSQRGRYRLDPWAGEGRAMGKVREQTRIAIESQASLTIVGDAGVGKEFLARGIHHCGTEEQPSPLLPLSCALLDAELLQATIVAFLHRFQEVNPDLPPTVLLLQADQMSAAAQLELLGFAQLPTVELRLLATAEKSLLEMAERDEFNLDLATRIGSLEIFLPRLAERREDVPLLAQRMIERFNLNGGKQLGGCSPEVLDLLGAMPWDGNLDELAETLEHAWQVAEGPLIEEPDLPRRVEFLVSAAEYPPPAQEQLNLDEFLREVEEELIMRALKQAKGNKSLAARTLGVQRARLLRRIAQLGLPDDTGR